VFDTSRNRHPLQFTIGNGQVIAGFEQAIAGMNIGESKTTVIPIEQAYGPRRDDMIVTVNRDQLPPDLNAAVGQRLEITQEDDQVMLVTVAGITESSITLDANHPLAGKALTFDLELVGIV
jgi:FKBP-type peptidyl-prolyl cis-trans isomerase 2